VKTRVRASLPCGGIYLAGEDHRPWRVLDLQQTVKAHRAQVMEKMRVGSVAELAVEADSRGPWRRADGEWPRMQVADGRRALLPE
jgi:uncharacterized phage-associated protein